MSPVIHKSELPEEKLEFSEKCSKIVLKPYKYVTSLPGKNIRHKLAESFNLWFKIPDNKFRTICSIIDTLHNASLIIDDIQDGSDLRRGFPSTHIAFGVPFTINSANYAYFVALEDVLKLGSIQAVEIFTNQMKALHEGQGMEIYWRDTDDAFPPTEAQYEQIVVKKASGLFQMIVQLMQLEKPDEVRDFEPLVFRFGLYFQMRDDYLNLISKEYEEKKGYCEDLSEGKFSFPIIHAVSNADNKTKSRILQILRLKTNDISLKKEVVKMLEEVGSFEYTKKKLLNLQNEILNDIENLGGNSLLEQLCNKILGF